MQIKILCGYKSPMNMYGNKIDSTIRKRFSVEQINFLLIENTSCLLV